MSFISNLFKSNKRKKSILHNIYNKSSNITYNDNLYTEVVFSSSRILTILISYGPSYYNDMIEFLSACNMATINFITMQTNNEVEEQITAPGEITPHEINKIKEVKNYVVISGIIEDYVSLYNEISSLSNSILQAVQEDIYKHANGIYFKEHIENGALEKDKFITYGADRTSIYEDDLLHFYITNTDDNRTVGYHMANPRTILSKLPSGFFARDIPDIITFIDSDDDSGSFSYLISNKDINSITANEFKKSYPELFKDDSLAQIFDGPKYLLNEDDIAGDLSVNEVDEIFLQKYEKFTGVSSPDTVYKELDEVVDND